MTDGQRLILTPGSSASPDEAAAIVAALERFVRATASPPPADTPSAPDGWHATALLEGVSRDPWSASAPDEWLDGRATTTE